jgi:hypothetical protein
MTVAFIAGMTLVYLVPRIGKLAEYGGNLVWAGA